MSGAKRIVATVKEHKACPLFKVGDRMTVELPGVVLDESHALCVLALADLLPSMQKLGADRPAMGAGPASGILVRSDKLHQCRGCQGGKAVASFGLGSEEAETAKTRVRLRVRSLKDIPLFAPLADLQLTKIAGQLREVAFTTGQEILHAGEPGRALYVVTMGHVEVVRREGESETVLAVMGYGETLGEMSLLTGDPVSATIRAKDLVTALEIRKDDFDTLLARNPGLNVYFTKLLALRLQKTSKAFLEELEKGLTGNLQMLAPPELIQAMTVTDRTGTLRVKDGKRSIDIYFKGGQIHAVDSNQVADAEEAVYEFMAWKVGSFRFEPGEREGFRRTFARDITAVLLEGMRRLDMAASGGHATA